MAWGWGRLTLIPDACILTVAISKSANQLRNSAVGLNGPAWRCEKLNAIDADINTASLFDGKPCCCCCCSCWCWIDDEAIWTISLIVASNVVLTTNFQLQISSIIGTVELCVCQASVRLSVPARAHSSKPAAASLLLGVRCTPAGRKYRSIAARRTAARDAASECV